MENKANNLPFLKSEEWLLIAGAACLILVCVCDICRAYWEVAKRKEANTNTNIKASEVLQETAVGKFFQLLGCCSGSGKIEPATT